MYEFRFWEVLGHSEIRLSECPKSTKMTEKDFSPDPHKICFKINLPYPRLKFGEIFLKLSHKFAFCECENAKMRPLFLRCDCDANATTFQNHNANAMRKRICRIAFAFFRKMRKSQCEFTSLFTMDSDALGYFQSDDSCFIWNDYLLHML